jgi:type III secretion system HrpE/YscL family protein
MSSCDRVMRAPQVSPQRFRVGDKDSATPLAVDLRPQSVQEAETRHAQQIAAMNVQHQQALEATYRNGYNDGLMMARSEAEPVIASLTSEFARSRTEWFAVSEQQVVELICYAVEQILGGRPHNADHVLHALRRAVESLGEEDRATVRLHPDDLELVRQALEKEASALVGSRRIRLTADDAIQPGGCLVETDLGIVDARVEQQLRILRGVLTEAAGDTQTPDDGSADPSSELSTTLS